MNSQKTAQEHRVKMVRVGYMRCKQYFTLFNYITDYTRCGNDSNQCVKIADICNFVVDCLNGWDETAEQCVSEVQRQMFVADGKL